MRPDLRLATAVLSALALAACADPQPAAPGGGGGGGGPTTGAHPAHLTSGEFANAYACDTCHDASYNVVFPAPSLARSNGASPAFDATSKTCSNVYCHAGGPQLALAGGTLPTPVFDPPSTVACGACHGVPPPAPHAQNASCGTCHDGYTSTVVNKALHLNAALDVTSGICAACHGDPARLPTTANPQLPAAPPAAPAGKPAAVVGTHQLHLNDNAIRQAVACASCHVVPADAAHAAGGLPPVVFGGLATTQGASPTYAAATFTCSATYCHGNFSFGGVTGNAGTTAPWDATPTFACSGCHGLPPTGHAAVPGTDAASCSGCHSQTVNADGTINVAGGLHINGAVNEGAHPASWADRAQHGYAASSGGLSACTTCHVGFGPAAGVATSSCNGCHAANGFATWATDCTFCHGTAGRVGILAGTDALLPYAPPVGSQGETATSQAAVGAHQAHVNPTAVAALASPLACAACHPSPLPTDVTHVDGQPAAVAFSGLAVTGGITTAAYASGSCSATYCHGNFAGGANATPSWTAGATTCTSCHGNPPNSGRHAPREPSHSFGCNFCHGTGYTSTAVVVATHVDGAKTMGAGTPPGWNPTTRNCTNACHPGGEGPW